MHQPGPLEHVQVVADRALRHAEQLAELARGRRPLAQEPDDAAPDLVAEGSQLGGIGDDERVGGVVVER